MICRISETLLALRALDLVEFKETKIMAAKKPMMEMTTNNSINVKPLFEFILIVVKCTILLLKSLGEGTTFTNYWIPDGLAVRSPADNPPVVPPKQKVIE